MLLFQGNEFGTTYAQAPSLDVEGGSFAYGSGLCVIHLLVRSNVYVK